MLRFKRPYAYAAQVLSSLSVQNYKKDFTKESQTVNNMYVASMQIQNYSTNRDKNLNSHQYSKPIVYL